MLILGIRYLNGWAMAKRVHDVDRPEWPPHPDRVFMALAAAHFETDGSGDEREVLEWLEQLDPPTLITSRCQERDTVTTFVPVNDSADPIKKNKPLMPAGSLSIGRDRQPRTFPVVVAEPAPSGESELYCFLRWDDAVPSDSRTTLLADLCRKVTHVGHSASLVQMWVGAESELPGADDDAWQEFVSGDNLTTGRRLRIPGTGRLTDLEARFNRTAREQYAALKATVDDSRGTQKKKRKADLEERFPTPPTVRRPGTFDETGYVLREPETRQPVVWHSHFDSQLIVLRNVGGQRFGLESTLQLTAALRNAVMAHCPIQPPPEWLSGHKPGSNGPASERETGHLAVVPLPHVDARHADGHLLGMALVVPRDVPQPDLAACLRDVLFNDNDKGEGREIKVVPRAKHGRRLILQLDDQQDYRRALKPETWTGTPHGSRRWATVTPIALDRHAKSKDLTAGIERIIADGCERIGLPRPADVIPAPVSLFEGAPVSREMPRIERRSSNGKIRQTHAIITFSECVAGPLLLGAGRYRGYGLCRPLD